MEKKYSDFIKYLKESLEEDYNVAKHIIENTKWSSVLATDKSNKHLYKAVNERGIGKK